jgi:hypothetical protein
MTTTYKLTPHVASVVACYEQEGGDDDMILAVVRACKGGRVTVTRDNCGDIFEGLRELATAEEDMAEAIAVQSGKAAADLWIKAGQQLRTLAKRVRVWGGF